MKTLCYIIPGLGNEDASKPPKWVADLKAKLCAASPDIIVRNASYTDGGLPERLVAEVRQLKHEHGECRLALIGHSDGAADIVWIADHAKRYALDLPIDLAVLQDVVTDLIRHGPLKPLPRAIVKDAVRIYQTADPLIKSNRVIFDDGTVTTELTMADFGAPKATHCDVPENEAVQAYIVKRVLELSAPAVAPVA